MPSPLSVMRIGDVGGAHRAEQPALVAGLARHRDDDAFEFRLACLGGGERLGGLALEFGAPLLEGNLRFSLPSPAWHSRTESGKLRP